MDQIERKIVQHIEENREQILAFADDIYHHAELGYKEFRTSEKFASIMKQHLSHVEEHLAVTGKWFWLHAHLRCGYESACLTDSGTCKDDQICREPGRRRNTDHVSDDPDPCGCAGGCPSEKRNYPLYPPVICWNRRY